MNTKNIPSITMATGSKSKGLIRTLSRGMRAVFVERRLPGRCYQWYFSLLNRLGIRITTVRTTNGLTVKGYTHCMFMFHEVWSKRDYDHPDFSFGKGSTVVDIGANQGFFSLYAASQGASVYSFEPCTDSFEILKWNVAKNGLESSVHAFNQAVTGKQGTVSFFVGVDSSGGVLSSTASTYDTNRGGTNVQTRVVQSTTLDSLLDDLHIEKCDLLKIDCEGPEYEILANTSQKSFDRIARISLEAHYGRYQEAVDSLVKAGFEITYLMPDELGLIKARNKRLVQ